jgi:hypothetical protein
MISSRLFLFFSLISFTWFGYSNIGNCQSFHKKKIIGEWHLLFQDCNDSRILIITDTNIVFDSPTVLISYSYFLSDSINTDGSISLMLFGTLISYDKGLTFQNTVTMGSVSDTVKASIFLENDILVFLLMKGSNRASEFQQPHAFFRATTQESEKAITPVREVFILPDNFLGFSWIAMEQPDGKPVVYDQNGRRVFRIPESGLLLTQAQPLPTALAKREYSFFFEKKENISSEPVSIIPENCLSLFKSQKLTEEQIREFGYDPKKMYVLVYRYNNPGREEINELFGRTIKGQVLWFRVDTLENLLKYGSMGVRF